MRGNQIGRKTCLILLWVGILLAGPLARAQPKFAASQITGTNAELIVCDLDGDGLKDLVLLNGLDLRIFYQDSHHRFTREPQQTYHLDLRPSVVWAASLGKPSESLLVMTSEGVTELSFTNHTDPPVRRRIIKQTTIIPDVAEETNALYLPLSARTDNGWPLLLIPAADELQVWQHGPEWHLAQVIPHAVDTALRPFVTDPGYTTTSEFDASISDLNGDGRDDLIIKLNDSHGTNIYRLYLQQTNGLFNLEPALTYADKVDQFSWLCWTDLNRDGRLDLIKSLWLNGPSFLPSVPSAKVIVSTFVADAQGRIPAAPQQVFRKNDWISEVPVLDLDGDGYPDLVLGYNHLESRESLIEEITARRLDYSLRFFFYRPGTGFPQTADCQRDVVIHLDHFENPVDWTLPENFVNFVRFGGDFLGNGKTDLLVRDHSDDISVYSFISRTEGFSQEPDLRFNCPEAIDEWQVVDLNHDGVSDLIVKLTGKNGFRIFVSQK